MLWKMSTAPSPVTFLGRVDKSWIIGSYAMLETPALAECIEIFVIEVKLKETRVAMLGR